MVRVIIQTNFWRYLQNILCWPLFFVLGEQVDYDNNKFHPVLKKMYDAGHQIASHSYSHADHVKLTDAQMRLETKKTEVALLNSPVNVHPNYWRPPEGETDERVQKVIESMGYKVVIWDLDTKDYTYMNDIPGRAKIVSTILDHLVDSHIALAHDIHEFSVDKMDELIKGILVKGYKLDTVGNCVKDALPYYRNKPNNLPPTLLPPKDGLHGNTTVVDTTKDVNNVKVTKGKSLDETSKKLENSAISERKAGGLAVTMLLVTIILGGSIMI